MGQILLVRHGQASWGADDYDVLSETGWEQSRLLGAALTARGIAPSYVVRGSLRRHRETAQGMAQGMTQGMGLADVVVDEGWDEFDHSVVFGHVPTDGSTGPDWFETAMTRWTGGEHDDYPESFAAFTDRVAGALRRTADAAGSGTALVVTSGGTIAWTVASLLGAGLDVASRTTLWRRLNPVCVNTGVTKVVSGGRGLTFVGFNEHTHLEPRPDLLTYR